MKAGFTARFEHAGRVTAEVPISGGRAVWQADQWPATRVSGLTVPAPQDPQAIGSDGHTVTITGTFIEGGVTRTRDFGTFLVASVAKSAHGEYLTVDADDLTALVNDHQHPSPVAVSKLTRVADEVATVLRADGVGLEVDPGVDRRVPVREGYVQGTDRGETLKELVQAWGVALVPGVGRAMRAVSVHPAEGVLVRELEPVVIGTELRLERKQVFNHVVVPVADEDYVAEAVQRRGRYGTDIFGWRSLRVDNLATGRAQAGVLARNELFRAQRRAVTVPVELVPSWDFKPFEYVSFNVDGRVYTGHVTGIEESFNVAESTVVHVGVEV